MAAQRLTGSEAPKSMALRKGGAEARYPTLVPHAPRINLDEPSASHQLHECLRSRSDDLFDRFDDRLAPFLFCDLHAQIYEESELTSNCGGRHRSGQATVHLTVQPLHPRNPRLEKLEEFGRLYG